MELVFGDCIRNAFVLVYRTNDNQCVVLAVQIFSRYAGDVFNSDAVDVLRVLIDVVESESVDFRMNQKARNLATRFERENKTSRQILLCILKFRSVTGCSMIRRISWINPSMARFMFSGDVPIKATNRPGSRPAVIVMLANVVYARPNSSRSFCGILAVNPAPPPKMVSNTCRA